MNKTSRRDALFISHANPEDNAFVRWLGAKLVAMGYEVWADIMRLHGGSDWSRDLEEALLFRTIKMLLVCTPVGLDKQGVRNEIEIGSQVGRDLNDREFIIPLRVERYRPPFRIAQAQYIDFTKSWASGLTELLELLTNISSISKRSNQCMDDWLSAQTIGATQLIKRLELLSSNWLLFRQFPRIIRYCEPPTGFPSSYFQDRKSHRWPVVPFNNGVLTFACPDKDGLLSPDMPARIRCDLPTRAFRADGWRRLNIAPYDGKRLFAELGNQAFEYFLRNRGLTPYENSSGRISWWGNIRTVPLMQISFDWQQQRGRRQIIGVSGKRKVHWHYAINGQVRTTPMCFVRLCAGLVFSENGFNAIEDKKRMHRLRRSFAKSWRNARWRDMLSAFLWWIADGQSQIALPVSNEQSMILALPTKSFISSISVSHCGEELADEDDPEFEMDSWEESVEDDEAVEDGGMPL